MNKIRLNFLPIEERDFTFDVYRKVKIEGQLKSIDEYVYTFRETNDDNLNREYFVSFVPKEGYILYKANFLDSRNMTKKFILHKLFDKINNEEMLFDFSYIERKHSIDRIEFIISKHKQGNRIVYLIPYFLEKTGHFGFLIDFKFSKFDHIIFDKEVQKLSLSLSQDGTSNKYYYTDKYKIIQNFVYNIKALLSPIKLGDNIFLNISFKLQSLNAGILNKKEYLFFNNNSSYSQFQGIKNFGPYKKVNENINFIFIFQDLHRVFANELYLSLLGKSNPGTFSGLENMFKVRIGIDNVKRITLQSLDESELRSIIKRVVEMKNTSSDKKHIVIYIEDFPLEGDTSISATYYFLKYHFIKEDVPLQVVNYRKLSAKNSLKWSTSNIALQIFSKLGGIPWIVKPSNNECLILGIGSSHKRDFNTDKIIKYFAYTVCLDSSGLYRSLDILAESEEEDSYLTLLEKNLLSLLSSDKFSNYSSCVLHLPFKIRQSEVKALYSAINQINNWKFAVIKINLDNKFFGYSEHNTLVPYESSYIQLSKREYLVWFEGLIYGKELVDKRLSNPVHIEFLNIDSNEINIKSYLQDVLNLSGANWRGFNSKSIPISIYYSKIIAEYTKSFEELHDYQEGDIRNDKPWFL